MDKSDLIFYLNINGVVNGFETEEPCVVSTVEKYTYYTTLPMQTFLQKDRKLDYLVSPRLFRYQKSYLLSYLLLYIDMKNPMAEVHLIDIIHPILKTCSRIDNQNALFEFFNTVNFTKAKIVYIVLKVMELITRKRMPLIEGAPPLPTYYALQSPPLAAIV